MEDLNISLNRSFIVSPDYFEVDILASITHSQHTLFMDIYSTVSILTAVTGIASNVINIRTFSILGLNDGVTMSFFALSVCDLLFLCIFLFLNVFTICLMLEEAGVVWFRVHPFVPITITTFTLNVCTPISTFNVTFLAVARCVCVSMPLRFKNIFTPSLCLGFFISSVVLSMGAYAPMASQLGTQQTFDAFRNATRIFLALGQHSETMRSGTVLFFDTVSPFIAQGVLIACIFVMTRKLRESARFRRSSQGRELKKDDVDNGRMAKLSSRDLNVVRQVFLISVIYIVTNTPRVFISTYGLLESEFLLYKRYHYFYVICHCLRLLFEAFNAMANFFVYLYFNSAFRSACARFKPKQNLKSS